MKPCLCDDCAQPMKVEEIHYYERRCEKCERAWSDRMGAWMRRETEEPEMETMFGSKPKNNHLPTIERDEDGRDDEHNVV